MPLRVLLQAQGVNWHLHWYLPLSGTWCKNSRTQMTKTCTLSNTLPRVQQTNPPANYYQYWHCPSCSLTHMTESSTGLCGVAHGTKVHRNLPELVSHMGRTKLVNNYTEFMLDSLHKEGIPWSQDLLFQGILNPKKKIRQLVSSTTESAPYELTVPHEQ